MNYNAIILARKKRKKKRRTALLLDDATSTLSIRKQQRVNQDFPMVSQLENQGREYGICVWVSTQDPDLIVSSAKNANVKIYLPLSSGAGSQEMARSLGLNYDESMRAGSLTAGEAILKVGTRKFGTILIDVEQSNVDRSITIEQARRKSEPLRKKLLAHVRPRSQKLKAILAAEAGPKKQRMDGDAHLVMVAELPGCTISEFREKYKLTIKKEMALRNQNVERGFIEVVAMPVSGRGANPQITKLTQRGKDRLAVIGKTPSHHCRGSDEHIFWQMRGKIYLEKIVGCKASLEKTIGDTTFDVYGIDSNYKTVGIEIEMSSSTLSNIKKGLETKVDRLIIACKSKKIMDNLRAKAIQELGEQTANRVDWKQVGELYLTRDNSV